MQLRSLPGKITHSAPKVGHNWTDVEIITWENNYKKFSLQYNNKWWSTAVEQAVARSRPGLEPLSGQVSWVWFFRGFSSPVRQISESFRPSRSPNIIWLSSISFHIHLFSNEWVREWCVSSFMFVLSRRWPWHWGDPSSGEALHVRVWSKKYYVIHSSFPLPIGRGSVRPGRREPRKFTCKWEVKLR